MVDSFDRKNILMRIETVWRTTWVLEINTKRPIGSKNELIVEDNTKKSLSNYVRSDWNQGIERKPLDELIFFSIDPFLFAIDPPSEASYARMQRHSKWHKFLASAQFKFQLTQWCKSWEESIATSIRFKGLEVENGEENYLLVSVVFYFSCDCCLAKILLYWIN